MNTTVKNHLDAIGKGAVTKTNVIGIRKILAHVDRLRAGWPGNRSNASPDEADSLEAALQAREPAVLGDLRTTGLKLLNSPRYAKRLTEHERATLDHFDHFKLIRFDRVHRARIRSIVPVYRVVARTGQNFVFRNIPWQSGGNGPEFQGRDF